MKKQILGLVHLVRNSSAPNASPLLKKIIQQFHKYAPAMARHEADFLAALFWPEPLRDDTFLGRWLNGTWQTIHDALHRHVRIINGRKASPSAAIIDSQTVKTTEAGGPRGFNVCKQTKGRNRHIAVDTLGLLIVCEVQPANMQDRDGGVPVAAAAKKKFPGLRHVWADGGYQGPFFATAFAAIASWSLEIVKRTDPRTLKKAGGDDQKRFTPLPRRWVVERTFAWLNRNRRLSRDFEQNPSHSQAYCFIPMTALILRRL